MSWFIPCDESENEFSLPWLLGMGSAMLGVGLFVFFLLPHLGEFVNQTLYLTITNAVDNCPNAASVGNGSCNAIVTQLPWYFIPGMVMVAILVGVPIALLGFSIYVKNSR